MICVKCKKETKDNVAKCEKCGLKYETTPVEMFEIKNNVIKKFKGGTSIVVVPENITAIGVGAFAGSNIKVIMLPDSITRIGDRAFKGCDGITSITIPQNVTTIGTETFSGCINLTSLTIPNSVKIINEKAFSDCFKLTNLKVPNSVTTINEKTFKNNFLVKTEQIETREVILPKVFENQIFIGSESINFTFE